MVAGVLVLMVELVVVLITGMTFVVARSVVATVIFKLGDVVGAITEDILILLLLLSVLTGLCGTEVTHGMIIFGCCVCA